MSKLHRAAKKGDVEKVRKLLDEGGDVNEKNSMLHDTPLHVAAYGGCTEMASFLLERGADINAQSDVGGNTPLHKAAARGHADTAKLLLEQGADLNVQEEDGETPLHKAVIGGLKDTHGITVKHLLERGADANIKNRKGKTPLDLALSFGYTEIANLLGYTEKNSGRLDLSRIKNQIVSEEDAIVLCDRDMLPQVLMYITDVDVDGGTLNMGSIMGRYGYQDFDEKSFDGYIITGVVEGHYLHGDKMFNFKEINGLG